MFSWDDLKPFLAVARTGSALAAAKSLGVNQTTVARRLAALEEALGERLFERQQSGAQLTDAGQELMAPAERVEAAALALEEKITARRRRLSGVVRVSAAESTANILLTPALASFREQHPDIAIEMHVDDRPDDLNGDEADVAIRAGQKPTDPGLVVKRLLTLEWAVYASRSYVARYGRPETVADVNRHQLIGWEGRLPVLPGYTWLMANAPQAGTPLRCNSLTNLIHVVGAGLGLAPLPVLAAMRERELVRVLEIPDQRESALWLVTTERHRHEPRVRAFLDFMPVHVASFVAAVRREAEPAAA
jgi:DNA-binding transcriptional LysR family regulator